MTNEEIKAFIQCRELTSLYGDMSRGLRDKCKEKAEKEALPMLIQLDKMIEEAHPFIDYSIQWRKNNAR